MPSPLDQSIVTLSERVRNGEISAESVARESLARIEETQSLGAFFE